MNLNIKFRERWNQVGSWAATEWDLVVASLRASWGVEHTEADGHSNITGYSLTLTQDGNTGKTGLVTAVGLKFPAVQVIAADPNTLDDYEEGLFTPFDASGAGLNIGGQGWYTKIGNRIWIDLLCLYPATASGLGAVIGGLPATPIVAGSIASRFQNAGITYTIGADAGTTQIRMWTNAGAPITNVQLSGTFVAGGGSFIISTP